MKTKRTKAKKMRPFKIDEVMETHRSLMARITKMTEGQLHQALKAEVRKPRAERRDDVIIRLHRKFTRIRKERELREYLGERNQSHAS